ncbi:hypothetical protein MGA447_1704 [Enterococcus faecalis]|nr:hypothetical protein MGA447_1704 [Enterococcus faecalis]
MSISLEFRRARLSALAFNNSLSFSRFLYNILKLSKFSLSNWLEISFHLFSDGIKNWSSKLTVGKGATSVKGTCIGKSSDTCSSCPPVRPYFQTFFIFCFLLTLYNILILLLVTSVPD